MRRQKCAQCGTMLDISKLEGGSKFACASCGAILVVGEATAVKKSLKESGPAFTPKSKADAPPAAPARRREERAERPSRRGEAPEKKSKMPLFIGAGVVVVAVVVVISALSGSGGGPGGSRGETAVEWWSKQEAKLAGASAEELRAILAEGRAKYASDPAFWNDKEGRIQAALVRKDPTDPSANERLGNKNIRDYEDFDRIYARMLENYKRLPPDLQNFADSFEVPEGKPLWLPPAKYAEVSGKLDEFAAWLKKAEENPAAGAIESFQRQAKDLLSKGGRKIGFGAVAEGPFVLLLAYEDAGAGEAASGEILTQGRKWATALRVLREEFDKRIREPLGLLPIEAGKYYCALVVPTADDLTRVIGQGGGFDANGDIPAYFSPTTRWAHLREPKEANEKALFGGDLGHEAVHQLQYHYSVDPKDKFENLMTAWNGVWLTEGLAEYLGGGIDVDPASGKASFSGTPPRRIGFLREMRDNGVPMIPVRELVQMRPETVHAQINAWRQRISEGEELPEAASQWLGSQESINMKLLYAHSWLLVHFLYEADDGKYRAKLLDLVMAALGGGQKPKSYRKDPAVVEKFKSSDEAFREIMGLRDEAGWKEIEAAHDRHMKSLRGE